MDPRHDQLEVTEEHPRGFRARALAQAHPFSPAANRYLNRMVARERTSQPQAEIGIWAGQGLTAGYCLRRVEEVEVLGRRLDETDGESDDLEERATAIAAGIRTTGAEHHFLLEETVVIDELDQMIAGEIDRRLDHWRGTVSDEAWSELEEYIAWWVVKGYALRIAETARRPEGEI